MCRAFIFVEVLLFCALSTSCQRSSPVTPVVVHVLCDQSFDADLVRVDTQFALTAPSVRSGRSVKVETIDDIPFMDPAKRLRAFAPDVLILNSTANIPSDLAVRNQLGASELACGIHPAFIPTSVTGEQREAAEMYRGFLVSRCTAVVSQPSTAAAAHPEGHAAEQLENDPNRPACTTDQCRKIKQFLKDHYCGESPFGNGPEDGCDTRGSKKTVLGTKTIADYVCTLNDAKGTSKCEQRSEPAPEARDILLREMRRIGLPPTAEKEVYFKVLESTHGWSLMSANYDHVDGTDLSLCQVIVSVDPNAKASLLRMVKLQKTNADATELTTWSPIDIADTDGDGRPKIVLEGDAYEDHWLEVIDIHDGSFKTIFSGLGYYL